jgi:hypothetical protein
MMQAAKETLPQTQRPKNAYVRIPVDVDADLERYIAGTALTKQEVVGKAVSEYLRKAPHA